MKLILEQRYLFDGSVAATAHHAADHRDHHEHQNHADGQGAPGPDGATGHAQPDAPAASPAPLAEPAAIPPGTRTLLVVDPRVTDWQQLTASVGRNTAVLVLDPTRDGVSQVTQALSGLHDVHNLEFLTDGTPGAITLGGTSLDLTTLAARSGEITGWSAALSTHADIVFWGCNVGEGAAGSTFIADMHTLTGATVGASTDGTGAASLGGNWTLEASTGPLHGNLLPFSTQALADYQGILDSLTPNVTISVSADTAHTTAGTALLGDTMTASISFSNGSANVTGFGPYVELFTQTGVTLSGSPTLSGLSLTTLTASIAAGKFTNPLTKGVESAPTGVTTGTMYLIELPYGSYTPGEPAAAISAKLQMANTASLVGTTLAVDARGAFRYGDVATGGSNTEGSDVTTATTVELVESYATVSTKYGEGETATGPDFPVQYAITILPAPAVTHTAIPITDLAFSVQLPESVVWTGTTPSASGGGTATVTSAADLDGTVQTLNVSYASLSAQQTVTIGAYVPEFYQYTANAHTAGDSILDPDTGAPVTVNLSPPYTFSADSWQTLPITDVPGNVSGANFVAKSLAVQLVANTSSALPTQDIGYTLRFQVSDYFGISGLTLHATLGDGLTFDPTIDPALSITGKNGGVGTVNATLPVSTSNTGTVNGETVQTFGIGTDISYLFDAGTGTTALTFNVGDAAPGLYGAGTIGTLTFSGTVLDKYPTGTDQVAGAEGFLRESDSVSTSSSNDQAAQLFDFYGADTYSTSVGAISDNTATPVNTIPTGSLTLSIAYLNGAAYTGQHISPGDTVVYELAYTLPDGGDFAGLQLSAFLPEPVFSVLHPSSPDLTTTAAFNATSTSNFTLSGAAASALASGTFDLTASAGLTGLVKVDTGTANEPANSVSFQVLSTTGQTYSNITPSFGANEKITIDFAVTASSLPFVNGLFLTAQADSNFTPAIAATFGRQTLVTVQMTEPLLAIKQGVVSIVDGSNTAIDSASGVAYSNGATKAPTTIFSQAGSGTVFVGGATVPTAIVNADDDLNLFGAQAGDTVRLVDAVQNTGGSIAYDVILSDALAQGLSTANIANLTFTRDDGTVLTAVDPNTGNTVTGAAAIADYFSSSGVLVTIGGDASKAVLSASGTAGDMVYATYDIVLPSTTPTAAFFTGKATIVAWSNENAYVPTGAGYTMNDATSGQNENFAVVGSVGATLTDTATITTRTPTVTDTITNGVDASLVAAVVPTNTYPTHAATDVRGETISLEAVVTVPQGTTKSLTLTDIIPATLTPITTAGSYTVTFTKNDGTVVDLTGSASWSGQTLSIALGDFQVDPAAGADKAATVVVDYQVIVPKASASPVDTSGWASATTGDVKATDSFAANSEGLAYTAITATDTKSTTTTNHLSGQQNVVTITNPWVTETITETGGTLGQTVHSQEVVTYQITLTNKSTTATAYDLGSLISLPTGMTYVAGSLAYVSGTTGGIVTEANVAAEGATATANALAGITLAPGATATYTFLGKVDNDLNAGTALKVTATPSWASLPSDPVIDAGNVAPQAQAYTNAQVNVQNSIANPSPDLAVIGGSNNTASLGTLFDPTGKTGPTAVSMTDGEIVRMRATLQMPEGSNSNITMTITLPTGLTYQNDGSTNVLLVSPNQDFTTTLTGAGLQAAETGAFDASKLGLGLGASDPVVATLDPSAIGVSGSTITFSLGTLANNDNSALSNYIIVEFNASVGDSIAGGTSLSSSMKGSANGTAMASVSDFVTAQAPVLALTKKITGIGYNPDGSATVTYVDTITNSGNAPAYGVTLTDPGAGVGTAAYTGTATGTGTGISGSTKGNEFDASLTLPTGGSESFTYTETIPAAQAAAAAKEAGSLATVQWSALNPALEVGGKEVLPPTPTSLTPATYSTTASAGLDLVSGTVNQDLSVSKGGLTPLQGLGGQTITASFAGQTGTETLTTATDGSFIMLIPSHATALTLQVNAATPGAPANDVLDNAPGSAAVLAGTSPNVTGTNPVTLSFTPAVDTSYTGLQFDFWHALDTAPTLANGPSGPSGFTVGGAPITLFPAGTVADAELNASFAHDFSGTTLTVQRYVGGVATPDGGDLFLGDGTASTSLFLNTANSRVLWNGAQVGTFTEAGGKLSITFSATGIPDTMADNVLQHIAYKFTGLSSSAVLLVVLGAQIDDANNDPIGMNGFLPASPGAHDQGPGGDLLSNVLTATVNVVITPTLSVVGASNNTAGLGTHFDPNGLTAPTAVTLTDGEIVRMRATLEIPEGSNGTSMTVTLPTGLTYQADGSATVLLVSPNQDFATTLTGTGLQAAETGAFDTSKLGLGLGASDPVVAALPGADISVVGTSVTFNLGTLANSDGSVLPNYVVVEFNAVVGNSVADGTQFTSHMNGTVGGITTGAVFDYTAVTAPVLTLAKQVTGISYNPDGSATVTYVDTVTNTGNGIAYAVQVKDPGAGVGTANYTGKATGTGTTPGGSTTGNEFDGTLVSLASGGSETFTYTETIPQALVDQAVKDSASLATATYAALNPALEVAGKEVLSGTSLTPATYSATASAGLDLVSGKVLQDVSPTKGTDTPFVPLAGQTVSVTFTGQVGTESVSTAADGSFTVLVPGHAGGIGITANAATPGAPANDVLDNAPDTAASLAGTGASTAGVNPAALSFTPAADTNYTGLNFFFWHALDTAPTLANPPAAAAPYTAGGTPVLLFPAGTTADAELNASFAHDFSGTTLTVQRYIGAVATPDTHDVFAGDGTAGAGLYLNTGNGQVLWNGAQIGSFTEAGGKLSITFAATGVPDTMANNVLQHIAYSFNGTAPLVPGVVLGAQIDDANSDPIGLNGFTPAVPGVHDQGPGGDLLSNVLLATVNVAAPASSVTFTEPNDTSSAAAPYPVAVLPTVDLSDITNTADTPTQITLSIAGVRPEDVLTFSNTADITGVYAGGTMTLTAVGGHAPTVAAWQAALRSVAYYNSGDEPNVSARTVTVTVTSGANTASTTAAVNIAPTNDSPILDTGIQVALNDSLEYQGTGTPAPSGVQGTLVWDLSGLVGMGPGNITDPDGAGLLNAAARGPAGIAITGFSTTDAGGVSAGTWYYSLNNGASWTAFPASISATHPLDLPSTARVYLQPTVTNFNGEIPQALTFRAWDGFDGTANGTQADLTGVTVFGQNAARNSAASAYSIALESLPLMIDNINNAPTISGSVTLPSVPSGDQHPPGDTVTHLFTNLFGDNADQQFIPGDNPKGSTLNPFSGIAVVGNAATPSQGRWEYSTDNGNTWTPIPTSVSDHGAIVLPLTAKLHFLPTGGFSGPPGELTVRAIDSSATQIASGLTGADLAADTDHAFTGVDVSSNGGSTAVSAGTATLGTRIIPVPTNAPSQPSFQFLSNIGLGDFPSDLHREPLSGLAFWHTSDYLSRTIIPELSLVGSVASRFVIVEQHAVISVPPNIFRDTLDSPQFSFEARRPDGTPLPGWLSFDARNLTFSGTPPKSAYGRLEIVIRATDAAGNTADADFTVLIGRDDKELVQLLSGHRTSGFLHLGKLPDAVPHVAKEHAPVKPPVQAGQHGHRADAHKPPPAAHPGFAQALRAAGPMGALSRARALLDSLDELARSRPAA